MFLAHRPYEKDGGPSLAEPSKHNHKIQTIISQGGKRRPDIVSNLKLTYHRLEDNTMIRMMTLT